jgi:hypothetical protein
MGYSVCMLRPICSAFLYFSQNGLYLALLHSCVLCVISVFSHEVNEKWYLLGNSPEERSSETLCLFNNISKYIHISNVYEICKGTSTAMSAYAQCHTHHFTLLLKRPDPLWGPLCLLLTDIVVFFLRWRSREGGNLP